MTIVYVLPNMSSGGAERVVSILSKRFVEQGIDTTIVYMFDRTTHYEVSQGVKSVYLDLLDESKWARVKKIREFLKEIKSENPIVIPFQDSCLKYILLANVGIGCKVISCERNNPYVKGNGKWDKFKAETPYKLSHFSVFQTHDARNYYSSISDKRCKVIANPIVYMGTDWNGDKSPEKLISVCRLHPQKNLPMLIDAIEIAKKTYSDICISIFGEGELKSELEHIILQKQLESNVKLCGRVNNVGELLAVSSVFLSSSDFEGISNSMLEAMSVGMPIICTDCPIGGARMMLQGGAGILTPVGDANALAQAIVSMLSDKVQMNEYARIAKLRSLEYSDEMIASEWISVFKMLSG